MQQVKMLMSDGTTKEHDAWKILALVNNNEDLVLLQHMKWNTTGPVDFLTGKITSIVCEVVEPLTNEQAEQAVKEYQEQGYRK
jgi:hypothetical protein